MAKPGKAKKPAKLKVNKRGRWFQLFTDPTNPHTFLNKTESAIQAGYLAKSRDSFNSIGCENFTLLGDEIDQWLEAHALSLPALKLKHSQLLETHKTVFQKIKGKVNGEDLPEGAVIITKGVKMMNDGDMAYDDGDTLIAINVADPEVQRKALDMAYKVKGEYAAEKRELGGFGGGPIPLTSFPPEPKSIEEWEEMRKKAELKRILPKEA